MAHDVEGFVIGPDPDMQLDRHVKVLIHPTTDLLNEWRVDNGYASTGGLDGNDDSVALTVFNPHDDDERERFIIHLSAELLELSIVVHEVVHASLWLYATDVLDGHPGATAQRHITNHDERLPYLIGNLAAIIWFSLEPWRAE